MTHRSRTTLALLAVFVCSAWPATAGAQARDHLKCYRTADASEAVSSADIESVAFGLDEGCTIEGKVRELCVPATADVLVSDSAKNDFQGDDLTTERLCYKIKCPKRALPGLQVSDRFGVRAVGVRRSRLLCLPVVADAAP